MTRTLHYGKLVDSNKPVTGVYSGNCIAWEYIDDEIDLSFESHLESDEHDEDECSICEYWEAGDTRLIGDWIKDNDGLYAPDKTGEFSAIFDANQNVIQVVWSSVIKRSNLLCSPCYVGQIDARQDDTSESGEYQYFAIPDELIYNPD